MQCSYLKLFLQAPSLVFFFVLQYTSVLIRCLQFILHYSFRRIPTVHLFFVSVLSLQIIHSTQQIQKIPIQKTTDFSFRFCLFFSIYYIYIPSNKTSGNTLHILFRCDLNIYLLLVFSLLLLHILLSLLQYFPLYIQSKQYTSPFSVWHHLTIFNYFLLISSNLTVLLLLFFFFLWNSYYYHCFHSIY